MFGELIFFNNNQEEKPNRFVELENKVKMFLPTYENPMSIYYNYDLIAKIDKGVLPPIKNKKISIKTKTSGIGGKYRERFNSITKF